MATSPIHAAYEARVRTSYVTAFGRIYGRTTYAYELQILLANPVIWLVKEVIERPSVCLAEMPVRLAFGHLPDVMRVVAEYCICWLILSLPCSMRVSKLDTFEICGEET